MEEEMFFTGFGTLKDLKSWPFSEFYFYKA